MRVGRGLKRVVLLKTSGVEAAMARTSVLYTIAGVGVWLAQTVNISSCGGGAKPLLAHWNAALLWDDDLLSVLHTASRHGQCLIGGCGSRQQSLPIQHPGPRHHQLVPELAPTLELLTDSLANISTYSPSTTTYASPNDLYPLLL